MDARRGLRQDLETVLALSEEVWPALKGASLFITGGTGFIGCWLLESLCHANQRLNLGIRATILTRNPVAFKEKAPHLAENPAIHLIKGDVIRFQDPTPTGDHTHLIHAATDASARMIREEPLRMFDTIVVGTRQVLDWASSRGIERGLFISSGAVYGPQPPELEHIPDGWVGAPDCAASESVYAEGKRAAENICSIFSSTTGLQISIARCFAFVGPYLPLDIHYAVGNFIRDALRGGPIRVEGDGTPYRSYLYAADMAAWLWHVLVRGEPGLPINVGSEHSLPIVALARMVGEILGNVGCRIALRPDPTKPPVRYVPGTERAKTMGLRQTVSLEEGIRRTADWYRGL